MKKYLKVEKSGMDIFTEEYWEREEAINAASRDWDSMTEYDQDKREDFYVLEKDGLAEEDDEKYLDGDIVFAIKIGGEIAKWYAVVTDSNRDWGYGSYSLDEARKMADEWPYAVIDVIVNGVCEEEIETVDDNKKFRILPEHWHEWGPMVDSADAAIVTVEEIKRLAFDWDKDIFDLMDDLEEVDE